MIQVFNKSELQNFTRGLGLVFILVLLLTACTAKSFRTKATYEAPKSGFRL